MDLVSGGLAIYKLCSYNRMKCGGGLWIWKEKIALPF